MKPSGRALNARLRCNRSIVAITRRKKESEITVPGRTPRSTGSQKSLIRLEFKGLFLAELIYETYFKIK